VIMRKVRVFGKSKKAITLVELVVAMALTLLFATACVILMFPVLRIYMHERELSRAQLVADSVVNSLRAECAKTYITGTDDVWISSNIQEAGYVFPNPSSKVLTGPVLIIRRNNEHCETIASDASYNITGPYTQEGTLARSVFVAEAETLEADQQPLTGGEDGAGAVSRAVYRLTNLTLDPQLRDASEGFVHFGYFTIDSAATGPVVPTGYYDFASPLSFSAYKGYTVRLVFHDVTYTTLNSISYPTYVLCDVHVLTDSGDIAHTRANVVLSFSSPVVQ